MNIASIPAQRAFVSSPALSQSSKPFYRPVSIQKSQQPNVRFGFTDLFNGLQGLGNALGILIIGGGVVAAGWTVLAIGASLLNAKENKDTRPKDTIGTVTSLDGLEAAVTPEKKVFIKGELVGWFNDAGEAFAANGIKMGHADETGNFFSVFSDKPVGQILQGGAIKLAKDPYGGKDLYATFRRKEEALSTQAIGAVGLILYKSEFP